MENIAIAFGKAVRQLRKERKLSQEQLGFEADLQRIYVSKLELGQQQPSLMTIFKLANGLQCSASELIQHTEEIHRDVGQ
ncbi:XRE family transcriptional regulator [Haemophilus parahaemolyticus]|uniref:helix-turn-helix domain-containing protein n=1 Tax=Haemophilus parahaemolyticus TaxID=735 RepID=UPI000DAE62D2|nr:helix-turn-helix transcriptional regulator [Haemophilus parahaemolyticus]RDE82063.1 XRE family transcriptional regulator [Haemophilus parahaemolyticus]